MKKIIIVILVLALLAGVGYFLWQHREEYFFQGEEPYETFDEDVDADAEKILEEEDGLDDEDSNEEESDEEGDDEDEFEAEENKYETPLVTAQNCENKCEGFSGGDLDYCNEICGFAEDESNIKVDDCEKLSKFERDVCYKQKAIAEKDLSFCKKISDLDLKENCENRALEEILK